MKKIVALALCLVLALSLCATAFAATATYDVYDANGVQVGTATTLTSHAGEAVDRVTGVGKAAYYDLASLTTFKLIKADSMADADYYVTYAGQTAKVEYYKVIPTESYVVGKVFNNFGTACGQVNYATTAGKTYYVSTDANDVNTYYVGVKTGADAMIMVEGKLVNVQKLPTTTAATKHVWKVAATDGAKVTDLACKYCTATAKVYDTKLAALAVSADAVDDATYGWIVIEGGATASTTTAVSSAKTFDAGIAMYVGMSIMAVTGSAVVIGKKKEF